MKKSACIEVAPLWNKGQGRWKSGVLMDDRVSDLFQLVREGPCVLLIRPNDRKRADCSPDAFLLAFLVTPGREDIKAVEAATKGSHH